MTTQVSVDTDEKLALIAHLMRRVGVGARQARISTESAPVRRATRGALR